MRKVLSYLFFTAGFIPTIGLMFYGIFLSFEIVANIFPTWFVYLSFIFFPFVYSIAPFYDLFVNGNWTLILINYGGIIPAGLGFWIGNLINPD
ncbi:hypothetical protein OAL80_02220 [Pelagibacteraceae bacterium]|nr:hypothetical protein [Pelagibacteraceae bacterium]